jgi:GNAT superfamily N-acetyltransferase
MEIRTAIAADVDGIMAAHLSAIVQICASAYKPEEITAWTAGGKDPERYLPGIVEGRFSVALIEGVVVGFCDLDVGQAEVRGLFVHAGYTGRGIGRALLNRAEGRALRAGVRRLRVDSTTNAIGFYRALGFVLDEMSLFRLRSGVCLPCGVMHKELEVEVATSESSQPSGGTA